MTRRYRAGKLPPDDLRELLARFTGPANGLAVGPGLGLDAAAVECRGPWVVVAMDPVTFTAESIGRYAVHVNANDVACLGARPRWFLATVLLPEEGADAALVESIFRDLADACGEVGAHLCGGHTEITPGLRHPLVSGTMLGELVGPAPVTPREVRPGDSLILTKGIAIEGTAILARDFADRLDGRVPAGTLERARGFLREPGISVVRDALIALEAGGVHGLHDPTEAGLARGVREMAEAAGVGFRIQRDAIPVFEETRALCAALGADPLGLIASGALLIATAPERAAAVVQALGRAGIRAEVIGEAVRAGEGVTVQVDGEARPWPAFERDELARLLEAPARYALLYDGECGFCRTWVERVRRRDREGRIEPIPFQRVDSKRYGIRRADLEEAMHLVAPDGRVWRGAAAAREVLRLLPGWRWASYALRIPGALAIAERVYRWIARRRHAIPCESGVCRRGEAR